ncbi:hypothetical protein HU755_26040 [Pseudomonas sp. SWRI111]|uniref:hypothetical protein n=1 Tax=Pseudomonas sp. SWRI111 TaxID=2745507 RepID=UPI001643FD9F|nr:hypothetical protein [Pseudomonas sp. SWRI111]MBC3210270.1 hypothetical protein [Pseudomonas sp. SWRI111]
MNEPTAFNENVKNEKLIALERTKRQRIVIATVTAVIGIPLVAYAVLNKIYATKTDPDVEGYLLIGSLFLIAGAAHTIFWYLQTGFKDQERIDAIDEEIISYRIQNENYTSDEIEDLKVEIENLKHIIISGENSKLTTEFAETIKDCAHQNLLSELNEKISSENLLSPIIEDIKSARRESTFRIEVEIDAIARRGNLNLVAGVTMALIGIGTLSFFIFPETANILNLITSSVAAPANAPDSELEQTLKYVTRTALVLSIEVLAFFFLRLYKSNLEEMKYFQNELTNLESKYISLITSAKLERQDTTHKILLNFVETERNHILEKGQSTIELKKIELEKNQFIEISKSLASLAPKAK